MAPALEGDIGSHFKYQEDADALNQSRDKAVFISNPQNSVFCGWDR